MKERKRKKTAGSKPPLQRREADGRVMRRERRGAKSRKPWKFAIPPFSRTPVFLAAAILLAALIAYFPAYRCGYIWDDNDYVSENKTLRDLHGLRQIWFNLTATPQYYPLVHTSYWIEYRFWGVHPAGYHAVNVLLHALNALLLWRVLLRLRLPGAFPAAVLFALHPVHVESVAWITERKNTLSAFFYLLALLAYCRFARLGSPDPPKRSGRGYALALFFYICALLSKTVTCSLPVAIALLLWMRRKRFSWRDYAPLAPFFVVGAGMGLLTVWAEKHFVGALGEEWNLTIADRGLIAGRALWFYLGKLLVPANLIFIYPRWEINAADWRQYLWPFAALAVFCCLYVAHRRIGKKPLAAFLFFFFTLSPALGFFDVYPMRYSFVADHFQYLASIGPIALFAGLADRIVRRTGARRIGQIALVAIAFAFGFLTWKQTRVYQDLETLWRDTIQKNPDCWIAINDLGAITLQKGDLHEARELFERALSLNPAYTQANTNLALVLSDLGDYEGAIRHCRIALAVSPHDLAALTGLGVTFQKTRKLDQAIAQYRKTLDIYPDYEPARRNLDIALQQKEKIREESGMLAVRLRENPQDIEAWNEWGSLLFRWNYHSEAEEKFQEALRVAPADRMARNGLALVLEAQGRQEEALDIYRRAVQDFQEDADARYDLARVLARLGKIEQAVTELEKIIEINAHYPGVLNDLGTLRATQGRFAEAILYFEAAIRANPDDRLALHNLERARKEIEKQESREN